MGSVYISRFSLLPVCAGWSTSTLMCPSLIVRLLHSTRHVFNSKVPARPLQLFKALVQVFGFVAVIRRNWAVPLHFPVNLNGAHAYHTGESAWLILFGIFAVFDSENDIFHVCSIDSCYRLVYIRVILVCTRVYTLFCTYWHQFIYAW